VVSVAAQIKPGTTFDRDQSDEDRSDEDQGKAFDQDDPGRGAWTPQPTPVTPEEFLRRFFEQLAPPTSSRQIAVGSGFIISPDGDIVTDDHIIADTSDITVILADGTTYSARIVGRDPTTDLALLRISTGRPLPYVEWGDSDATQVGDWILPIGNPFGLGGSASFGIISGHGRDIGEGPYDDFLQIDASINRGNSGGPSFNLQGQVIGINTAIYTPSGGSVGIAFAIPSGLARPIIEQLRRHGKVTRGWLGMKFREVPPEFAKSVGLGSARGALVEGNIGGSPADRADIRKGDVILSFAGQDIRQPRDLQRLTAQAAPGQKVAVTLWRSHREITLSVVVAEMPTNPPAASGGLESLQN
jgi:serine protease Do